MYSCHCSIKHRACIQLCLGLAVVLLVLVLPSSALAGDMASHLTATYVLARQAGLSDRDARLIAMADWSMDLNPNTTALPGVELNADSFAESYGAAQARSAQTGRRSASDFLHSYQERGATYHALGDPESVRAALVALRAGTDRVTEQRERLIAVGQYLHALQDVYFHQSDGQPYSKEVGHALEGHNTDRVALHFDGALKAYEQTYEVLKALRETRTIPEVPPVSALYHPGQPMVTAKDLETMRADDVRTGVLSLAQAISSSYEDRTVTVHGKTYGEHAETVVHEFGDPNEDVVRAKITEVWSTLHPEDRSFDPPVRVDPTSPQRIDYETHPELLVVKPGPAPATSSTPGGISLTMAAAAGMPIAFSLDGSYIDGQHLVLAGTPGGEGFDAALFLTALRLACERDDPYFSLDPDDGKAWASEGDHAADEVRARLKSELSAARVSRGPGLRRSAGGVTLRTISVNRDYPQLWEELAPHYPNLRTRLVFHPVWLRETRLGEILYWADVLLKELSTGAPLLPKSHGLRAADIQGYASSDARGAGRGLLASAEGREDGKPSEGFQGYRLWFDLVPQVDGPRTSAPPAPDDSLPPAMTFDLLQPRARAEPGGEHAAELRRALRAMGIRDDNEVSPPAVRLASDEGALDLSGVYPQMFIRRHDHATGKDLPGKSPDLDALAGDVNARIATYAKKYAELGDLIAVFRAYVAGVKIAVQQPDACAVVQSVPLLRGERATESLPDHRPSELVLTIARYREDAGTTTLSFSSLSGGVSLGVKSHYAARAFRVATRTPLTEELKALAPPRPDAVAWRGESGHAFVALTLDSREALRGAAPLRAFRPIAAEDVLSGRLRVTGPATLTQVRRLLARLFGNVALGLLATLVVLVGFFLAYDWAKKRVWSRGATR
jgi:hypothetical protein